MRRLAARKKKLTSISKIEGMNNRVGVQGFYCLVRTDPQFAMTPRWYFTTPELERFLGIAVRNQWDTVRVGTMVEAFAARGGDMDGVSAW